MIKKFFVPMALICAAAALPACGGQVDQSCDDVEKYQLATPGRRIEPPDDLDKLNELREVPLPKASPRPPRAAGAPCLDLPPSVLSGDSE
jgi:hypothetical protein